MKQYLKPTIEDEKIEVEEIMQISSVGGSSPENINDDVNVDTL